jgi:hypothetical protein
MDQDQTVKRKPGRPSKGNAPMEAVMFIRLSAELRIYVMKNGGSEFVRSLIEAHQKTSS